MIKLMICKHIFQDETDNKRCYHLSQKNDVACLRDPASLLFTYTRDVSGQDIVECQIISVRRC